MEVFDIEVPIEWSDDDSPLIFADQFMLQPADDTGQLILLALGEATPPIDVTPEKVREKIKQLGGIRIRVRGRFLLSGSSLRRLHSLLGELVRSGEVPQDEG